jgi:hypothetical protein
MKHTLSLEGNVKAQLVLTFVDAFVYDASGSSSSQILLSSSRVNRMQYSDKTA